MNTTPLNRQQIEIIAVNIFLPFLYLVNLEVLSHPILIEPWLQRTPVPQNNKKEKWHGSTLKSSFDCIIFDCIIKLNLEYKIYFNKSFCCYVTASSLNFFRYSWCLKQDLIRLQLFFWAYDKVMILLSLYLVSNYLSFMSV